MVDLSSGYKNWLTADSNGLVTIDVSTGNYASVSYEYITITVVATLNDDASTPSSDENYSFTAVIMRSECVSGSITFNAVTLSASSLTLA